VIYYEKEHFMTSMGTKRASAQIDDGVKDLIPRAQDILRDGESLRRQGYPIHKLAADLSCLQHHFRHGHKRRVVWYALRVKARVDYIDNMG
jgi:hypothetical protein